MTDTTHELAHARAALQAPGSAPDTHLLGAVHHGLLLVGVGSGSQTVTVRDEDMAQLAIRRRVV